MNGAYIMIPKFLPIFSAPHRDVMRPGLNAIRTYQDIRHGKTGDRIAHKTVRTVL